MTDDANKKIDNLARMVQQGFQGVDEHVERLEKRFDSVDKRFEELENRLDNHVDILRSIQQELRDVHKEGVVQEVDMRELRVRIERLEKRAGIEE